MRLNKKHILCFFLIMFITLICCCTISAADNADGSMATAADNDVSNIQTVGQTVTSNIQETSISTEDSIQSENDLIGDKNDQNDVKDNNDNLKVIEKVKSENSLKGEVINPGDTIPESGNHTLGGNLTVTSTITLNGDLTIDGKGYTITGRGLNDLFDADNYKVTLKNVTITNLTGYVVSGGNGHVFTQSAFINNGGVVHMYRNQGTITLKNCLIENSTNVVFNYQHRTKTTLEIGNCIFKNNEKAIVLSNNHLNIRGYNFNVINGDLDEIMNQSVAEFHSKKVQPSDDAPDDCYFA
ncbi:MAG: hypothetical protein Q4Q22_09160, partial [Methanosphaera sp.]|nr:hypothetical protein [Methanosphaera sp.]